MSGLVGIFMGRLAHLGSAALLGFSLSAMGGAWTDEHGKVLPDTLSRRSSDDFGVQLVLTNHEKKLRQAWALPTLKPQLPTAREVRVGGSLSGLIIFTGCKPDANGACDVSVQYSLQQPDAKRMPAGQGPVFRGKPKGGALMALGETSVSMAFTAEDVPGPYILTAMVTDRVARRTVELIAPFILKN